MSELFERHVLPEIRDTVSELGEFVASTEGFLDGLNNRAFYQFRATHEEAGVSTLPDGTSLEEFFSEYAAAWPEGRLIALLRQWLFAAMYAYIEFSLMELCRLLRRKDIKISVGDLRGLNQIDRTRDYISRVLVADFPADSAEWQQIQLFRRVRNAIVHNGGQVPGDSGERKIIEQYAQNHAECLRLRGDTIILERGACRFVLEVFRRFVEQLAGSLVPYVRASEASLEPFQREYGEYYIGRPLEAGYIPPPPDLIE